MTAPPAFREQHHRRWLWHGLWIIPAIGSIWHFVYDWSGHNDWVALVAPVNESVWEHLKMGYWGVVLFAALEYACVGVHLRNYFTARLLGILALSVTVLGVFYTYTALTGRFILWLDITSFFLGVAVCQGLASLYFHRPATNRLVERFALIALIALAALLAYTTVFPPHWDIFMDHNNATFGIPGSQRHPEY